MWNCKLLLFPWLLLVGLLSGVENLKILGMFPLNGKSHHVLFGQLAKGLAAKGHQIDVYSHFPLKKPLPNFHEYSLEGSLPKASNNLSYEKAMELQINNIGKIVEIVGTPTCKLMELPIFKELRDKTFKEPYDLIVVEAFMSDCYLAWGRHLGIPMVGIMSTPLLDWYNNALGNPFNTAVTTGMASDFRHPMTFWQRLQNTLLSQLSKFLYKNALNEQDEYVEKIFGPGYPSVFELQKDLDLLLINAHSSLEGNRAYTPAIVPIAGLHIAEDDSLLSKDVQKWLDESKDGFVYVSFGSMVRLETFPKPIVESFYATFEKIKPIRVLMKIAEPDVLIPGLPSNVMTQKWLPQLQVLKHKHIKAFVTHGGLMSSLESINYGVPMIGIPIFGDQFKNVKNNVYRGHATSIQLDQINKDTLASVVEELLHNPKYKEKAEKLRKTFVDRPMTPMNTAIFWIEYIGRHGKGALRSPLADISWCQEAMLDIYAFFALIFYVIYYVLRYLLKKLCGRSRKDSSNTKSKKNK